MVMVQRKIFFTEETTLSICKSVILEPEGKHIPFSNNLCETDTAECEKYLELEKTGCKCIGFQSGRASISSPDKRAMSSWLLMPTAGSTMQAVSQWVE